MSKGFKSITRRDFLNGTLMSTGALLMRGDLIKIAQAAETVTAPMSVHPHALTGLRGSHPGSFERAHELAREGREDWGDVIDTREDYDLVIVGGGASGLAAAYFYQQAQDGQAKILVLENHDDFGGHAKRNEFGDAANMRMTYGGSQGFDNIDNWPDEMWTLLDELGIDLEQFESEFYDRDWFKRHGLMGGVYLDEKTWGQDHMMASDLGGLAPVMPGLAVGGQDVKALFAKAPLPQPAKDELVMLYDEENSYRVIRKFDELDPSYESFPYNKFLTDFWNIKHPATFQFLRKLPTDENGVGAETLSLGEAIEAGMPGTVSLGKKYGLVAADDPNDPGYSHHFPDGNAGFCRSLVQALIPNVAPNVDPEKRAEGVVLANFSYGELDQADNATRIRLNATAIDVKHDGPVDAAEQVAVTYVYDGKPHKVQTAKVIMACWNMIIPFVCKELPDDQKEALSGNVKIPYVFANVFIKNWEAIKKSKIGAAYCPTSYFHLYQSAYPVSMGGYKATDNPGDPMPITLIRVPVPDELGMEPKDQFREGRGELLGTEFATYEAHVIDQLNGMFGAYGFDSKRDIESITVNRWPHGYSYTYFDLYDNGASLENGPHILARQRFGRIAIANSDSGADSWLDVGVMQGLRAVKELIG